MERSYIMQADPLQLGNAVSAMLSDVHGVEVSSSYIGGIYKISYCIGGRTETAEILGSEGEVQIESSRPLDNRIVSDIADAFANIKIASEKGVERIVLSCPKSIGEQAILKRRAAEKVNNEKNNP